MKTLIFGHGKIGDRLITQLKSDYLILKRTETSLPSYAKQVTCDYSEAIPEEAKDYDPDLIIFFPKTNGTTAIDYYQGYLTQIMSIYDLFPRAKKVFISSTRVYGGQTGQVDEETIPEPADEQGEIIKKYEDIILSKSNSTVLRLGGIISEESNYIKSGLIKFSSGEQDNKYINAIHIKDVVSLLLKIIENSKAQPLVNGVMPELMTYSQINNGDSAKNPTNAGVKSLHYNSMDCFQYKSPKDLL
jgi:nucleoside-diphosphate-sugar epimerase